MLNIEAPAQLILTLQSVPPFIVESIFALALTVLLAVPLIAQIQIFFVSNTQGMTGPLLLLKLIVRRTNR